MSTPTLQKPSQPSATAVVPAVKQVCSGLHKWLQERDYSGHEPNDITHSPLLDFSIVRETPVGKGLELAGQWLSGTRTRYWLSVPRVKTPGSVALALSACCDLYPFDPTIRPEIRALRKELLRLVSPNENELCWGEVSHVYSGRGAAPHTFKPNAFTSYLCGTALLNVAEKIRDEAPSALEQASSVARFFITRLNRTVDEPGELCFSSTPENSTRVFHGSALVGSFLARLWLWTRNDEHLELAQRTMNFVRNQQLATGAWYYGMSPSQHRIYALHHSHTLCAIREYRQCSGDDSFDECIERGHEAYKRCFFETDGTPKYSYDRTYPVDIACCAQAISHFCAFAQDDLDALDRAVQVFEWTKSHMRNLDGSFAFRRYGEFVQRTPYISWGQSRMFRALTRLRTALAM